MNGEGRDPIVVELPVCPRCLNVCRQPANSKFSAKCRGPKGGSHPMTNMKVRRFIEDVSTEERKS